MIYTVLALVLGCIVSSAYEEEEALALGNYSNYSTDSSRRRLVHASGWYGGNGGGYRTMFSGSSSAFITRICFRSGSLIDQITVYFSNGAKSGPYGGNGGGYECYPGHGPLWSSGGNCITTVSLRTGSLVDGMQFYLKNGGYSKWYGGHGGGYHTTYGYGECLSSLNVRTGSLVDAIQFFWGNGRRSDTMVFDGKEVDPTKIEVYVFWIVIVLVIINCICLAYYLWKRGKRGEKGKRYNKVTTMDTEDEEAMDQMIS